MPCGSGKYLEHSEGTYWLQSLGYQFYPEVSYQARVFYPEDGATMFLFQCYKASKLKIQHPKIRSTIEDSTLCSWIFTNILKNCSAFILRVKQSNNSSHVGKQAVSCKCGGAWWEDWLSGKPARMVVTHSKWGLKVAGRGAQSSCSGGVQKVVADWSVMSTAGICTTDAQ